MKWAHFHLTILEHMNIWEFFAKISWMSMFYHLIYLLISLNRASTSWYCFVRLISTLATITIIFTHKCSTNERQKLNSLRRLVSIKWFIVFELMVLESLVMWWTNFINSLENRLVTSARSSYLMSQSEIYCSEKLKFSIGIKISWTVCSHMKEPSTWAEL